MKVLIALDESPVSARAARVAANLFSGADGTFVVVNVERFPAPWVGASGFGPIAPVEPGVQALETIENFGDRDEAEAELAAQAAEVGIPRPQVAVRAGDPATEICAAAEEHDVDVIVVGSHDKTLLRRLIDPSVAASVVRDTHRPVLVVSGQDPDTA
jgi:nucleotide-binding universal stress UspA family protein